MGLLFFTLTSATKSTMIRRRSLQRADLIFAWRVGVKPDAPILRDSIELKNPA